MGGSVVSRRRVFCRGCANLLYVGGRTRPMCVASAQFVQGPLRKRIDVEGVVSAESRNRNNDCTYYTFASMRAWEVKRWLLWRLNDGVEEKGRRATERSIEEYPISAEAVTTVPERGGTERQPPEEPEDTDEVFGEEAPDAVLFDGGAGSDEQYGSPDTDGGELIQDP